MSQFKQTPLVSIIMPTYNRAELIMQTIQSVLDQTYNNWKLIILDDGSDDNTEEKVSSIRDPRIHFVKMGRVAVSGRLKNEGIAMSNGELIGFIDSDDLWAPDKLEKQITALLQNENAAFSLTGGYNFRIPGIAESYFYKQKDGLFIGNIFRDIFRSKVAVLTPTLLFWRSCLDQVGGFNEDKAFSDSDFIFELAWHYDAVVLYEPLFYRRLHEGNDSDANWKLRTVEGLTRIKVYKKIKRLPRELARDAIFRLHIHTGEKYLRYKKYGTAIAQFWEAWKVKPYSYIPLKKSAKTVFSLISK
jgi:Glycosyltransferases involved in cell wall biogenesis